MISKLACTARVHAWVVDKRYVSIRCRDPYCPDVVKAKAAGEVAFHVFDLLEDQQWTEFQAATPIKEEVHHGTVQ